MSTTIFFLRHGEPDNSKQILYGLAPIPLTPLGRKQIKVQAQALAKEKIVAIFASPTVRGQQTAEIVAKALELKVTTDDWLAEWTSSMDGRPLAELRKLDLAKYNQNFEPQKIILSRMKNFVRMVLEKYPGQEVVAVSHQGPLDLLLFNLQGKDTSKFPGEGLVTGTGEMIRVVFNLEGDLLSCQRIKPEL